MFEIVAMASGLATLILCFIKNKKLAGVVAIMIAIALTIGKGIIANDDKPPSNPSPTIISTIVPTSQPKIYGYSFTDAKSINIENDLEARIDESNNEHWYYFESKEDTLLTLALSGEAGMSLGIYLYDNSGNKQLVSEYGKDQIVTLTYPIQMGKYYLKITSNMSGLYNIKPSKKSSFYSNEETTSVNDTYQNAIVLTLGESQNGHLGYYNDIGNCDEADWYKFSIEAPTIIDISLIADDPLDVKVSLIGNDGNETIMYDSGKNRQINIRRALQTGTFYIKISKLGNYGGYNLSTKATQPKHVSDAEPNNSFQYASKISTGNAVYGQIGFIDMANKHDAEDWYIVQLNSTIANLSLTPIDATGNIHISLLDNTASSSLANTYCYDSIATCKKEKLEPGTYYVKISASGDTFGCYSFMIN